MASSLSPMPQLPGVVWSNQFVAAAIFAKSKGAGSRIAVSIAKECAFFTEIDFDDKAKGYAVAFGRDKEDIARLVALMPIISQWRGTIFMVSGRPARWAWDVQQMFECYIKSFSHYAPEEYCKTVHEYGPIDIPVLQIKLPGEIGVQPPEPRRRPYIVLPCRLLTGWKVVAAKEAPDAKSQIMANAIEKWLDVCPRFSIDHFIDSGPDSTTM